jgi:hypothetical protein
LRGTGADQSVVFTSNEVANVSTFFPDFVTPLTGPLTQGGHLTLTATVVIDHTSYSFSNNEYMILGMNPDAASIAEYIDSKPVDPNYPAGSQYDYHKLILAMVMAESSAKQFTDDGAPHWSEDGKHGAGLMQLTPATYPVTWNWKDNIDAGIAVFSAKLRDASGWAARVTKKDQDELTSLNAELAPFTSDMLVREAVRRYNSGSQFLPQQNPDKTLYVNPDGVVPWIERDDSAGPDDWMHDHVKKVLHYYFL